MRLNGEECSVLGVRVGICPNIMIDPTKRGPCCATDSAWFSHSPLEEVKTEQLQMQSKAFKFIYLINHIKYIPLNHQLLLLKQFNQESTSRRAALPYPSSPWKRVEADSTGAPTAECGVAGGKKLGHSPFTLEPFAATTASTTSNDPRYQGLCGLQATLFLPSHQRGSRPKLHSLPLLSISADLSARLFLHANRVLAAVPFVKASSCTILHHLAPSCASKSSSQIVP